LNASIRNAWGWGLPSPCFFDHRNYPAMKILEIAEILRKKPFKNPDV
jgi:hypothetical protein